MERGISQFCNVQPKKEMLIRHTLNPTPHVPKEKEKQKKSQQFKT